MEPQRDEMGGHKPVIDVEGTGTGVLRNKLIQTFRRRRFVAYSHTNLTIISDRKSTEVSRDEVIQFQKILSDLGYTLTDVVRNKPTQKDSLEKLQEIAIHICKLGVGERFLKENPISHELEKLIDGDHQALKKYRPYLCAMVIIHAYPFPKIREYLNRKAEATNEEHQRYCT